MLGDRRDGRPDIFKPRNVRRAAWLRGCELPLSGKWDEVDDEESGSSGLIVLDEGLSGSANEDWFNLAVLTRTGSIAWATSMEDFPCLWCGPAFFFWQPQTYAMLHLHHTPAQKIK